MKTSLIAVVIIAAIIAIMLSSWTAPSPEPPLTAEHVEIKKAVLWPNGTVSLLINSDGTDTIRKVEVLVQNIPKVIWEGHVLVEKGEKWYNFNLGATAGHEVRVVFAKNGETELSLTII